MSAVSDPRAPRTSEAPRETPVRLSILLGAATRTLVDAGVPSPDVDAELLAAHAFGLSRGALAAASVRGDDAPADTAGTTSPAATAPAFERGGAARMCSRADSSTS